MGCFASTLAWRQLHSSDSHATETKAQKTQSKTNENAETYSFTHSPGQRRKGETVQNICSNIYGMTST